MVRSWLAIGIYMLLLWSADADARKVALIIGNSDYEKTGSLDNPVNDAKLVAASAERAGFDDVIVARDLSQKNFQRALRNFREKANGAEVAMIYYAGHGIEGQGKNWLIPVDAELKSSFDLPYESINLERVMESLDGAQIRMVILDACRNNPFGRSWKSGRRAVARGLIGIEADDVLVIYAAAPGQTATDGDDDNSPFATSLAKRLPQPDLPIQLLGGAVRDDVLSATGGNQRPFVSASITGTPVYLVRKPPPLPAPAPAVVQRPPANDAVNRAGLDALMWRGAVSANTIGGFRAYLGEFPNGLFADMAAENITRLTTPNPLTVSQRPPVSTVQKPEPQKITAPAPEPDVAQQPPSIEPKTEASPQIALAKVQPPSTPLPQERQPEIDNQPTAQPARMPPNRPQDAAETAPQLSGADLAYVAPTAAEPDVPQLPPTPKLDISTYPDCREDWQKIDAPFDRADDTTRCTKLLDQFYSEILTPFRERMIEHQNEISKIYTDKVAGRMEYKAATRDRFYAEMMQEHGDSNPDGVNLTDYRATEKRYQDDRAYLQDRFCFNSGCNGYAVPDSSAKRAKPKKEEGDEKQKADKGKSPQKCKNARKGGGLLGGILGGVVGDAAGLGTVGTIISSGFGAVLVGEIACQLTADEQKEAAKATIEVTEKEEVGAVANWQSPSRKGVSGSSTVTALNTEPNGSKCLNITDVAIIDGEETRVSKRMCRGRGDSGYTVMASLSADIYDDERKRVIAA